MTDQKKRGFIEKVTKDRDNRVHYSPKMDLGKILQ